MSSDADRSPAGASNEEVLRDRLAKALTGEGAHTRTAEILDDLPAELAARGVEGFPHTICAVVRHLVYWHDFALAWLRGEKEPTPEHDVESWPGPSAPESDEEWAALVVRYREGHARIVDIAAKEDPFERLGKFHRLNLLLLIANHDSYHAGQVALMRRALGAWPPPGGGATW